MKVCVLFSGGKDSSLCAIILKNLGYDVELVTVNFGVVNSYKYAKETANILNLPHKVLCLNNTNILQQCKNIILKDGFPSNGIQYLHREVLNIVAKEYNTIADGIRRDDRVPKLNYGEIQSYEMKNNVEYISPLMGFGHKTIRKLINQHFIISEKLSEDLLKSDYETEIRELIRLEGKNPRDYFPSHIQSRVIGLKNIDKK